MEQENQTRKLKQAYIVFFEGEQAEYSLVRKLQSKARKKIVIPISSGIQLSKNEICTYLLSVAEESGNYQENDKIVYLCDTDNVLETDVHTSNFIALITCAHIEVFYTYPCIELICHIHTCTKESDYKKLAKKSKEEIKQRKNLVVQDSIQCDCFAGSKFNEKFLQDISISGFQKFINNADALLNHQKYIHGDFDVYNKDYCEDNLYKIVNKNINHTTIGNLFKELF